jgi:hypothetical protein
LNGKDAAGSLGGTVGNDLVGSIQVAASATGANYNFGNLLPAVLSGFVYNDSSDNNGIMETGEPGIAGATVTLTGANDLGAIAAVTATTAADGSYSFGNLRPGTYIITETTPSGYIDGKDAIGTQGGTVGIDVLSNIVMSAGVVGTNNNFAELKNIIAGHTYRDMSGNGMTSDDVIMPGVTISLYLDRDGNATLDSGDGAPVATMVSNSSGAYSFGNMASGQYFAEETVPTGYVRTYPLFSNYYSVNLTNSPGGTHFDFDNYMQVTGTVTNISYTINGTTTVTDLRGQTDQGDTVTVTFTVSGTTPTPVTFVVYNAPGPTFDATVASQQTIYQQVGGTYAPGTYSLTVTLPQNYYQIDFVSGAAINPLGPANSNIFYSAQGRLFSADNEGTNAVGQPVPASVSGFVWLDLNDDGKIDFNETAISGVTIQLTGTSSTGTAVSQSTVTDSNGYYQFASLPAGTYTIHKIPPAGYIDGLESLGTAGGTIGTDMFSAINLAAGVFGINYNFGEQPTTLGAVTGGETATIGFWNNCNGQALLDKLNGSSTSTQLGNWLAATCPNLFSSLKGLTDAQVAAYYQSVFKNTSLKVNAQVLSVAFAAYASSSQLAGTVAASYGFKVTTDGVGDATFNVGSSGAAFGVANNVTLSVIDLLHDTDALSLNGILYNGNTALDNLANTVYSNINQTGDITS